MENIEKRVAKEGGQVLVNPGVAAEIASGLHAVQGNSTGNVTLVSGLSKAKRIRADIGRELAPTGARIRETKVVGGQGYRWSNRQLRAIIPYVPCHPRQPKHHPKSRGVKPCGCECIKKAAGRDNRLYVHEVFTEEEIKKSDGMQTVAVPEPGQPHGNPSDYFRSILQKLLDVNLANVSQVVNENGEPKVVYHGMGARFDACDKERPIRSRNEYVAFAPNQIGHRQLWDVRPGAE